MRRAFVLVLSPLLLAVPAGAAPCPHVVVDPRGDVWGGAVPDASLDLLHTDFALTPTTLDVTVGLADVKAKPASGRRAVFVVFGLGAARFLVEHSTDSLGTTATLYRVHNEVPPTPAGESGTFQVAPIADVPTRTDAAAGLFRVRLPRNRLVANGATVDRGTPVERIDVGANVSTPSPTPPFQVRGDLAQRPRDEPYRLGDRSCA